MAKDYPELKLENQLCFPLYAASKEIVKKYRPFLENLNLTYTQYIAMMVLWQEKELSVKELGEKLYLDSGTLTPLLKSMEQKGFVTRQRSEKDERVLIVKITPEGEALKKKAASVPQKMIGCVRLTREEAIQLHTLLYKVLGSFGEE